MKKLIFLAPILLLAAACNQASSPSASTVAPVTNNNMENNNFKSYADNKLGFSLEYPNDWQIDTSGGPAGDIKGAVFESPDSAKEMVSVTYWNSLGEASLSVPANIKRQSLSQVLSYQLTNMKTITFAGTTAYSGIFKTAVVDSNGVPVTETQIWVEHAGHVYEIDAANPLTQTENKIIESFKFTVAQ